MKAVYRVFHFIDSLFDKLAEHIVLSRFWRDYSNFIDSIAGTRK
jgi:hypothetical protein